MTNSGNAAERADRLPSARRLRWVAYGVTVVLVLGLPLLRAFTMHVPWVADLSFILVAEAVVIGVLVLARYGSAAEYREALALARAAHPDSVI